MPNITTNHAITYTYIIKNTRINHDGSQGKFYGLIKTQSGSTNTLGTRGFSRVRREFLVLAEGRHIFGRRPKPREKPLALSGAFYRPR